MKYQACAAIGVLLLVVTSASLATAQQSPPPASIPSCDYTLDVAGHAQCPAGPSAVFQLAPGATVNYTFAYRVNFFQGGASFSENPSIFLTAQLLPSIQSAGISFYDTQSMARPGSPPQIAAGLFGTNTSIGTNVVAAPMFGRQDTVQVKYTSGVEGPVTVQFWNYAAQAVTFSVDQSGMRYGAVDSSHADHTYVPVTLQSASTAAGSATAPQAGASGCQFILGFMALHDLDPADIGDCKDNQAFAPNGDAQQHTTKGLMAWRKADNWTAFTNGYMTWINGPTGLVKRLNTDRFPWESA